MNTPRNPDSIGNTDFMLGQITQQLRELVHGQNNMTQAMSGLETNLTKELKALSVRVTALEAEKQRREGAVGVVAALAKSPAVAWLAGAAISAWAILTGKVHL